MSEVNSDDYCSIKSEDLEELYREDASEDDQASSESNDELMSLAVNLNGVQGMSDVVNGRLDRVIRILDLAENQVDLSKPEEVRRITEEIIKNKWDLVMSDSVKQVYESQEWRKCIESAFSNREVKEEVTRRLKLEAAVSAKLCQDQREAGGYYCIRYPEQSGEWVTGELNLLDQQGSEKGCTPRVYQGQYKVGSNAPELVTVMRSSSGSSSNSSSSRSSSSSSGSSGSSSSICRSSSSSRCSRDHHFGATV